MEYKHKRRIVAGLFLFLFLILYLFDNLSTPVRVLGFLFGLAIFYALDHMFEIEFELKHYLYMILILAMGILFAPLYSIYSFYDKVLHLIMPIFACLLMFHIVDKKNLTLSWKLLITFMFVISFLSIHEMGEYLIDIVWDMRLQGVYIRDVSGLEKLNLVISRIDDTMIDMILGVVGALSFVVSKISVHFFRKRFIA